MAAARAAVLAGQLGDAIRQLGCGKLAQRLRSSARKAADAGVALGGATGCTTVEDARRRAARAGSAPMRCFLKTCIVLAGAGRHAAISEAAPDFDPCIAAASARGPTWGGKEVSQVRQGTGSENRAVAALGNTKEAGRRGRHKTSKSRRGRAYSWRGSARRAAGLKLARHIDPCSNSLGPPAANGGGCAFWQLFGNLERTPRVVPRSSTSGGPSMRRSTPPTESELCGALPSACANSRTTEMPGPPGAWAAWRQLRLRFVLMPRLEPPL